MNTAREFRHEPVMVAEIVEVFAAVPPGVVLDATLGGGGHSAALLESRGDLRILGIDRDPAALAAVRERLAPFGDRVTTVHARFDELERALAALTAPGERPDPTTAATTATTTTTPTATDTNRKADDTMPTLQDHPDDTRDLVRPTADEAPGDDTLGIPRHPAARLSGALFDLGVSSPQFDDPARGFSYRQEGPLDMRMDTTAAWSAADVVNGYAVDELTRILRRYGDERFAARIARAIVAARPIETTTELAAVVVGAIPAPARRRGGHPAKRTFQAIRIEVNAELSALPDALDAAIEATTPGGRIAVLSYHSGEDRIVKERFRRATGECDCPPDLPCVCGAVQTVRIVRGVPRRPSAEERERNPRAASARLRVVERTEEGG